MKRARPAVFAALLAGLTACGGGVDDVPEWSRALPGRVVAVFDGQLPQSLLTTVQPIVERLGLALHLENGTVAARQRTVWVAPSVHVGYASLADSFSFRDAWRRRSSAPAVEGSSARSWFYADLQILVDSLRTAMQREAPRGLGLIEALGLTNLRYADGNLETVDEVLDLVVDVVSASPDARPAAFLAAGDTRPSLLPSPAATDRVVAELRFVPGEAESAVSAFTSVLQGDSPLGFLAMAGGPLIASAKRAIAASDGRLSVRLAEDGAAAIAIGSLEPAQIREALAFLRRRPSADEDGELSPQFTFAEGPDHLILWRGREPTAAAESPSAVAASLRVERGGRSLALQIDRRPGAELSIRATLR